MAKRKKAPQDSLPNRKYVRVGVPAATTTAAYSNFETMMGAREGAGWLISRVDISPLSPLLGWAATAQGIRFQVSTGAQTAVLNIDDDEVIANIDIQSTLVTEGALVFTMPVSWVGPVLVASRQLSCVVDAAADTAPLQSMTFVFTLWYQWVKLGAREWVEIAEAKGIA